MSTSMNLAPFIKQQWSNNGAPLSGGQLYSYQAGTTTPQNTYTDQSGATPNTNPVVLDANGEANVWLDPNLSYKFVMEDALGSVLWSVDNVVGALNTNSVTTNALQDGSVTRSKLSASLSANQILGANAAGTALEAKTVTAGGNITITNTPGSLQISAPGVDSINEQLDLYDAVITAGESILVRNAVSLDFSKDSSNNQTYRIFNGDSSIQSRKSGYFGIATAAASVTAGVYTWVASANFVTSNVIAFSINGRPYSVNFSSNNATTLQSVATTMATDPEVSSAVSDGVHTITVTGKGSLFINITGSAVTGGASQPTITVTNTTIPVGGSVTAHGFGPLAGFSGLVIGQNYYLSTAGGITAAPADTNPKLIGQAISPTVLFVNIPSYQFPGIYLLVVTHGTTTNASSGGTTTAEHFNFTSWSAGASDSISLSAANTCDAASNGFQYSIDGLNTSNSLTSANRQYNKTSYATGANRSTAKQLSASASLSNNLYIGGGTASGSASGALDMFNGASWSNGVASFTNGRYTPGAFFYSATIHFSGGGTGGGGNSEHDVYNGTSLTTSTTDPASGNCWGCGSAAGSGLGMIYQAGSQSTASYTWNGSWSSSFTNTYAAFAGSGGSATGTPSGGYNPASQVNYDNGGYNGSSVVSTSSAFNGSAWAASTSSTNSKVGGTGGVF